MLKASMLLGMSQRDKQTYRATIHSASTRSTASDSELLQSEAKTIVGAQRALSEFVAGRISIMERVLKMGRDSMWSLPRLDSKRITGTVCYLQVCSNRTETDIEVSILQATAIDLLLADCGAELAMYEEFCELRLKNSGDQEFDINTRADWLAFKRRTTQVNSKRRIFGFRRSRIR